MGMQHSQWYSHSWKTLKNGEGALKLTENYSDKPMFQSLSFLNILTPRLKKSPSAPSPLCIFCTAEQPLVTHSTIQGGFPNVAIKVKLLPWRCLMFQIHLHFSSANLTLPRLAVKPVWFSFLVLLVIL